MPPNKASEATMKAAIVTGPGEVQVVDTAIPEPGAGEARIRLQGCGVCSSNLGPWSGPDWMRFPTGPGDLGHEGWGTIDAVGPDVEGLEPGDRVAALTYHAYAEFDVGPAANFVVLPAKLARQPFPGEPFGCAMNIIERSDIRAGQTVAIIGIGFLGSLLTQLASAAGARVVAISRRPFSLEMARRMGAAETVELTSPEDVVGAVADLTDGRLCDRTIEATGKQGPLHLAGDLTGERGRLVIAGYHQDGPREINMQQWNWRGLDVINAHERDPQRYADGMRSAIAAVEQGSLDPGLFLTHRYPLSRLAEALDATRDRPEGFLKAWIEFP